MIRATRRGRAKPRAETGPLGPEGAWQRVSELFAQRGWQPFDFQQEAWRSYLAGESGLIHAGTGMGKTWGAWLGPVLEALAERPREPVGEAVVERVRRQSRMAVPGLRVVWITPLRALAADTLQALQEPLDRLGLPWLVESRTSDTSASVRQKQRARLPTVLVTTPESLTLLLTRPDAAALVEDLRCVIVDEWHELLGSKRGVQTELALARLRRFVPPLRVWGLSATLGNLPLALQTLLGAPPDDVATTEAGGSASPAAPRGRIIAGLARRSVTIDSILPENVERFPWAGHLGLKLLPEVVAEVDGAQTSLIFTNTRSQTEQWYQALLTARPDWAGWIALHHGSLERETRAWVEQGLRSGQLKCVVCTSTLDLGVDFAPVERVFQVGSPKGIARLLQRAGRSGHAPGRPSRITCVPTHAWELVEAAAAREASVQDELECRGEVAAPLDLLTQHVVSMALAGGFEADALFAEIRTTYSYRHLDRDDFEWVLDFVTTGGESLRAYPDYHRVRRTAEGRYELTDPRLARQHRLSVGTIVGEAALTVQFVRGARLGTVEESFIARLKPGDEFIFAGRRVELVRVQDNRAWVRKSAKSGSVGVPRWMGGRLPLSTELSAAVLRQLARAARGQFDSPELRRARPLIELQCRWSHLPQPGEFLIERIHSREGWHLFCYPFAGRLVHEGLAALFACRLSRQQPLSCSMAVNDYGFELLLSAEPHWIPGLVDQLLAAEQVTADILQCLNSTEMGKRQFREVAQIAGLVFSGYPHDRKSARQVQASTGLLYDVFTNYDPANRLLLQAREEVLERQLQKSRLLDTLARLRTCRVVIRDLPRFSPLCFPLLVDRLRERLTSEKLGERIRRLQSQLERSAGDVAEASR